jgi:hypothetical protein
MSAVPPVVVDRPHPAPAPAAGDALAQNRHVVWVILCYVALLIAASLLRSRTFAPLEVGLDGALSMDLARGPLADMLSFNLRDVHPPLFYATLKLWFAIAGVSYFSAKYLVILLSVLGTAAYMTLVARLSTRAAGLVGGALLVLAPTAVLLGPAVRDYTPGLALSLLSLLLVLLVIDRQNLTRLQTTFVTVTLAFLTACALLTWYFHLIFFVVAGCFLFGRGTRNRLLVARSLVVGVLLALPWYLIALPPLFGKVASGTTAYNGPPKFPAPSALLAPLAHGLGGAAPFGLPEVVTLVPWAIGILVGVAAFINGARTTGDLRVQIRRRAWGLGILGLFFSAVFLLALTTRWNVPDDLARYVLVLVPFAALLQVCGLAIGRGPLRWAATVVVVCLLVSQAVAFRNLVTSPPIDWAHDPAVESVRQRMLPGDTVIFNDLARHLRFDLTPHDGVQTLVVHSAGQRYLQTQLRHDTDRALTSALPVATRIWYLEAGAPPGTPPVMRTALAERAYLVEQKHVEGTNVVLTAVGTPRHTSTPNATFGMLATLTEADTTDETQPSGIILIALTWNVLQPDQQPYSVFVHVEDQSRRLVAQQDGEPDAGLRPTTTWRPGDVVIDHHAIVAPASTGTYNLYVGLYRGDVRLTLPDGNNQLRVGTVSVTG